MATAALVLFCGAGAVSGQEPAPSPGQAKSLADPARPPADTPKPDAKPDPNALVGSRIALGESNLQSIRYTASGTLANSADRDAKDAPPTAIGSYDVVIDYPASTMQIDVVSLAGADPAAPLAHHLEAINGTIAWDSEFVTMPTREPAQKRTRAKPAERFAPTSAAPRLDGATSVLRRQAIWMTPHGFLKAAMSNQPALRVAGSGTEVSFYAGPHRYVGFLNSKHQVERVRTWIRRPELGDLLVDTTYTDYAQFGDITFPTRIRQLQNGRPVLDLTVTGVEANPPVHIPVPKNVGEAAIAP